VFGALLGRQAGRSVEICNSFELVIDKIDGRYVLEREYFLSKEEQCKPIMKVM
jgi:COP9 signalosome complex subunit 6